MKDKTVAILLLILILSSCADKNSPSPAPLDVVHDNYYGLELSDPYRYMENMDDTVFLGWMKEYADYSRQLLDQIPGRDSLISQMEEFDSRRSEAVYYLLVSENDRYFYTKIRPSEEKEKLYFRNSFSGSEELLYDPDAFSNDESLSYVINNFSADNSGKKLCVSLAPNGSEILTMIVIDVGNKKVLRDKIEGTIGSAHWLNDGSGFTYIKTNSDNIHDPERFLNTKVYLHKIGDSQSEDALIFSSELFPEVNMKPEEFPVIYQDPYENDFYLGLETVDRYLQLFRSASGEFTLKKPFSWMQLIRTEDQVQKYYVEGNDLYLYTAKNNPGFEILKTSKLNVDIPHAEVIVPAPGKGLISGFSFSNEALYYTVVLNGVQEKLFRLGKGKTETEEIDLPEKAGSIYLRTRGHMHDDVWLSLSGWTLEGKRFRYIPENQSFVREQLSSKAEFPEFDDIIVEEIMVPSYDGVMVPLSIMYKKGTPLNGSAPLLLNAYGSYGVSLSPYFSFARLIWNLHGGILAVAHVRGGGELGDSWRLGGFKQTKPNTWKDFIACTEYLQANNYSSPEHTAIYGGSAGGITIGRAMTERPELYAAVIPMVGVMNPVRLEESPNGPANAPEFGTKKDSAECMWLIEMDAYLHIHDGVKYPGTLISAGFNDPRVIVWQPAKFAARLQAANSSKNPILLSVDYASGHGVGDTKTKKFESFADVLAFAFWQTGPADFQK